MSESYGFKDGLAKFQAGKNEQKKLSSERREVFPGAEPGSVEEKANHIHQGLIQKITEVKSSISEQILDESSRSKVISHEEAMLVLLGRFAEGDLELDRDQSVESRKSKIGDRVSFYRTSFYSGHKMFHANILIRKDDFISPTNMSERAGQRISFELIPAIDSGEAEGRSMVRMDNDFALEYDLEVNLPEYGNIIDKLDLSEFGQSGGHHFRALEKITGRQEFSEVLNLFDKKAESQVSLNSRAA